MGEKRCSTCHLMRPLTDFSRSHRAKDGRQNRCRDCWKSWYDSNRVQHIAEVTRRNAAARHRHQERLTEHLLSHPCVDCGERDIRVLDLDHEDPEAKADGIARLVSMNIAWERVEAEIAKCSVRCANCHRRRTAEMFGYWRSAVEQERRAALATRAQTRLTAILAPRTPRRDPVDTATTAEGVTLEGTSRP